MPRFNWFQQSTWPPNGPEHVFLGRVVHQIGKVKFADKWTGKEPVCITRIISALPEQGKADKSDRAQAARLLGKNSNFTETTEPDELSPAEWKQAQEIHAERVREHNAAFERWRELQDYLRQAFVSGELVTATRAPNVGYYLDHPATDWGMDSVADRFKTCQMRERSSGGSPAIGWIYVTAESLECFKLRAGSRPELTSAPFAFDYTASEWSLFDCLVYLASDGAVADTGAVGDLWDSGALAGAAHARLFPALANGAIAAKGVVFDGPERGDFDPAIPREIWRTARLENNYGRTSHSVEFGSVDEDDMADNQQPSATFWRWRSTRPAWTGICIDREAFLTWAGQSGQSVGQPNKHGTNAGGARTRELRRREAACAKWLVETYFAADPDNKTGLTKKVLYAKAVSLGMIEGTETKGGRPNASFMRAWGVATGDFPAYRQGADAK